MASSIKTPKQALSPAFLKQPPNREEIELFKKEFLALFDRIDENESEEFHKNLVKDFLNAVYYKDKHYINTKGRNDLVIHNGNNASSSVGVLIETKSPANKAEMIRICTGEPVCSPNTPNTEGTPRHDLNKKSFHELVLYYLRERKTGRNFELRNLMITNIYEWFVFDAQDFEKLFYQNTAFINHFEQFQAGKLSGTSTDFFYKEIVAPEIARLTHEIPCVHFDIRDYKNHDVENEDFVALYKFFSPVHLLKRELATDNNKLNKEFYNELLHILGLTETQSEKKIKIERKSKDRNEGSLLELTIAQLETIDLSQIDVETGHAPSLHFDVALSLIITWINRILFLKLLEAQLLKYNSPSPTLPEREGDSPSIGGGWGEAAFLTTEKISTFSKLNALFFQILAQTTDKRPAYLQEFINVPYLNSSLFEETEFEKVLKISALPNDVRLPLYEKSVLAPLPPKGGNYPPLGGRGALEYLLHFLNAYNFSGIQDAGENPDKLISAAVLGLIFEKINGYKDGSFFTPSFITMYMCRETIGRAVVQKFNEAKGWNCHTINDVHNHIGKNTEDIKEANRIFNTIRICDPAVGSGHFLVSALNEMIYLKSELGILADEHFKTLNAYQIDIESDELTIKYNGEHFRYNPRNAESQRIQKTFFHEKQTIIENCLFGVDINPNSVKICQLRLWIELLKHAYYLDFKHADNADACTLRSTRETDFRRLEEKNLRKSIQSASSACQNLQTLPNIDINIKCGNSLMSRFDLADKYHTIPGLEQKVKQATQKYKEWVSLYKNTDNKEAKRQIVKNIENEKAIFYQINNALDADWQNLKKVRDELATHTQSFSIFDTQINQWNDKAAELSEKVQKLEAAYNEKKRGCFEWRFEFPEVLDDNGNFTGFDVVIGNPPYVSTRNMENSLKETYKKSYILAQGQYDLFTLFIEKSNILLNTNGIFSFIIPKKLLTNENFRIVREFLLENLPIRIYLDTQMPFESAAVEANVIVSTRKKIDSVKTYIYQSGKIDYYYDVNNELINLMPFKIFPFAINPKNILILEKILQKTIDKLGDYVEILRGMECGFNHKSISKDNGTQKIIKGEHIDKYIIRPTEWYVTPNLCEKKVLKSTNIYQTIPKLVTKFVSNSLDFALDEVGYYNTNVVYNVLFKEETQKYLKFFLGLCNSKVINFWFFNTYINDDKLFPHIQKNQLDSIPVILPNDVSPFESLVNKILSAKKENPAADTTELEREIDGLVYGLYGLTEEEIKIIEGK